MESRCATPLLHAAVGLPESLDRRGVHELFIDTQALDA
jgi:hypothetical protein